MNKVTLIGRTTRDLELRYTQNNKAVVSFTLAVDRRKKDEADFVPCIAWEKTAENMSKYVKKGHRIAVAGHIQTRSYDKDGQKVYVTEVIADEVEFLEKKEAFTEINDDDGELPF